MATLFLWTPDLPSADQEKPKPKPSGPQANAKELPVLKVNSSSSSGRAKKSKINGGGAKKQPQRGLGVAQLERLRLQEQSNRRSEQAAGTRLVPLQPYGGAAAYSLIDARHGHAKQLAALNNNRVFAYGVGSNPSSRSLCTEPQLPFSSMPVFQRCAQPFLVANNGDSLNCDNSSLNGGILGFEEDGRFKGLAANYYPQRLLHSGRKEMAGIVGTFQKPALMVSDAQFVESSEILPSCLPLLQGSAATSKVGVPLTVDRLKELSSFQIFQNNSYWPQPGTKSVPGKNHPWYLLPQQQNYTHSSPATLDLKLAAGENNIAVGNGEKQGDGSLMMHSNASGTGLGSVVYKENMLKTSPYSVRQECAANQDYRAHYSNNSRKRYRNAEDVIGSKHSSDFLDLTLSTTTTVLDSGHQSLGETDYSQDTVCKVGGCLADHILDIQQADSELGGVLEGGQGNDTEPLHTYTFLPALGKDDLLQYRSFLDKRSNNESASAPSSFRSRVHNDTTSTSARTCSLDLSLKLAV